MITLFVVNVKKKKNPVKIVETGQLICQDIFGLGMDRMLKTKTNVPWEKKVIFILFILRIINVNIIKLVGNDIQKRERVPGSLAHRWFGTTLFWLVRISDFIDSYASAWSLWAPKIKKSNFAGNCFAESTHLFRYYHQFYFNCLQRKTKDYVEKIVFIIVPVISPKLLFVYDTWQRQ